MSEAMNIFMNSYLKKMKRPEMGGGFAPDQAFGANLVHGSESLNPSAIRDNTNAMYGSMKSPLQQGPSANIPGIGGVQNIPFMGGNQNTPFTGSMNNNTSTPMQMAGIIAPNIVAPWLTEKLKDLMRGKPSDMVASTMAQSVESPTEVMMSSLRPQSFGVDSGLGGYESIGQEFTKDIPMPSEAVGEGAEGGFSSLFSGIDPTSVATTAGLALAPTALKMATGSNTVGNVAGAGISTGLAAAQGGLNPISDLAAVYSLYNFIRGLF